ncbi:hypothetical protein [Candidatus Methylocalor cossyra]|uniref:Uncharacterized protein n=1 Tax=Candidatus Methylocalor cossyra TaxID=3108543 RepID=A0ABP1C4H8_9GAMM
MNIGIKAIGFSAVALTTLFTITGAAATEVVTLQCSIFNPQEVVHAVGHSAGVTALPPSVARGAQCAQALADLIGGGYKLVNSFPVVRVLNDCSAGFESPGTCPGYAGPYFVFSK